MKERFIQTEEELKKEIKEVWRNANFGNMTKTEVVRSGLLKCATGYSQGHTSKTILEELKMINKKYQLTKKGKFWLYKLYKTSDL